MNMKRLISFIITYTIMSASQQVVCVAEEFKFNPFDLKIAAALKSGYETNVFLDSSHKGDLFTETDIYAEGDYRITEDLIAGIEYDFIGLVYHQYTDLNFMDNEGRAFLKYYANDRLSVKCGYLLDSVWYPHDKEATYLTQGPLAGLGYYINDDLFLDADYTFKIYEYDTKKIKGGSGEALATDREDYRHSISFGIGQYIKELLIKVEEKVDFNDSNDEYMDYYDYVSYKTSVFVSMPVFEVLYLVAHGSYKYKDFDSRQNSDLNATETQKVMTLGATAYYNVYKSLYLSAGYSYSQNYSNEPLNRYSDSTTTTGLHFFF